MGAIAGVFERRGAPSSKALLQKQAELLSHRGKQFSLYTQNEFGAMHRRDQTTPAIYPQNQPYTDASGRYAIVCAGRIFNHTELQTELGIEHHTCSILETILATYIKYGVKAFKRFNGAFCCAIWDDVEKSLLLARDHCGIKQMFYHINSDTVVFGSEVKSVLADSRISQNPSATGIAHYLMINRYLFGKQETLYENVFRLLPGQYMRIDQNSHHTETYWQIDSNKHLQYSSDEECIDSLRELIVDSIRIRMPATSKLGAALSGGFDSSSIVCVLDHLRKTELSQETSLDTFSFNFGSDDADEIELIDLVSNRTNSNHHHINALTPTFFDDLDKLIYIHDGPLLESSILCLYTKKRTVRNAGIDVILSGLGGDEVFMGTLHYLSDLLHTGKWINLVKSLRSIYPVDLSTGRKTSLKHIAIAYMLSPILPDWVRKMRGTYKGMPFPPPWISPELLKQTNLGQSFPERIAPKFSSAFDTQFYDLFYFELLNGAIPYQDEVSGAFALETRYPYLDIRLIETMFALDQRWKLDGDNIRLLQKQAMKPFLPKEIYTDHLKKNFHGALHRFTRKTLKEPVENLINGKGQLSREYIHWPAVQKHMELFFSGQTHDPTPLWLTLNLERWLNNMSR